MPWSKKVGAYFRTVGNHLTDFGPWLSSDNLVLQGRIYTGNQFPQYCYSKCQKLLYLISFFSMFIYACVSLLKAKVKAGEEGWFSGINDKGKHFKSFFFWRSIKTFIVKLHSEEAYFGPDVGPFQTLVIHDMPDRQLSNPLKGTVSPLVKTVPGYVCCPQRLEAKSKLEMLYTNMKNWLLPAQIHLTYDLTSAWLQDVGVNWTFVLFYVLIF